MILIEIKKSRGLELAIKEIGFISFGNPVKEWKKSFA